MNINIKIFYYFIIHHGISILFPFFVRILILDLILSSSAQPTKITSGIYSLAFYQYDKEKKPYAVPYDTAVSKCNGLLSRLVIVDGRTTKKGTIIEHIRQKGDNPHFWVLGKKNNICVAYNMHGGVTKLCNEKHFYICEQAQATVSLTPNGDTFVDRTTITCIASGYPIPSITWKRNDIEILTSSSKSIYQTRKPGEAQLKLENQKLVDEGKYQCVGINTFGGHTYTARKTANIKVSSAPTSISVTGYSCNSSLSIEWKPHSRAIGVKHRFLIKESSSNQDITRYTTPYEKESRIISVDNLTSSSQYSIKIQPCSTVGTCYTYSTSTTAITGGFARKVSNAMLQQENDTCLVSWSPPRLISPFNVITLYQLRIEASVAYAPLDVEDKLTNTTTFVNSSVLSYLIPRRPNRKYTVYVQAKTCAGLGDKIVTSGKCVTDAAAPASGPQPHLRNKNFGIENGTLQIYFTNLNETNGLISCVFIVVTTQHYVEEDAENLLRELNSGNSTISTSYIAIASDRIVLQKTRKKGAEIFLVTVGDGSKTKCDMKNVNKSGQRTNDRNLTDIIEGNNKRLEKDKKYQIRVITSTPSDSGVLFQVSKKLIFYYSKAQVADNNEYMGQITLISVGVVIFIAVSLLVLYAFSVRPRKDWRFNESTVPTSISPNDIGLDNRTNSFEFSEESDDCTEHFDNETTGIEVIAMSKIRQPIETANPCNGYEETKPDDLYENFVSDTTVNLDDLDGYFKNHAEKNNELFFEQYQDIKVKSRENMKSMDVALQPDSKRKNRYKNILPFDSTRVILKGNATGYINACYIDGFNRQHQYIATQGPLSSTVVDFWLMVIEQNCKVIVMLAKCTEREEKKCYKYWPNLDASFSFGSNFVENVNEVKFCGFVQRTFRIYVNGDEREMEVTQYQYLAWPDHGVPFTTSNLVRMQKAVTNTLQTLNRDSTLIVHCSAGVGRSGTYIAYDILLEEAKSLNKIDFYSCVMKMRSQRIDMIQTCDQYILVHKLILESYTFSETDIPANRFKSYFQDLIRDRKELSSNFGMLDSLINVEATETNVRNRATIRESESYLPQRNTLFIPPEYKDFEPPRIEAFWIEAYDENNLMIAARDPTESTANSFWRGVLYNKAETIIMLSNNQHDINGAIIERSLKVCGEYGEITVTHLQCTDWNADDCPKNGSSMLKLIEEMRMITRQHTGNASLIHCSDGVGRTGIFCATVNLIDRLQYEGRVDVFSAVKDLRDCKRGMVQTLDQYVFCHQVIIDHLKTFELYSNFE